MRRRKSVNWWGKILLLRIFAMEPIDTLCQFFVPWCQNFASIALNRYPKLLTRSRCLESVQEVYEGLQSFRTIKRMEAS